MASSTKTIAGDIATFLQGQTKPVIAGLVYSTGEDFKVVGSRPMVERDGDNGELRSWVVTGKRTINSERPSDRCGVPLASQMRIVTAKHLKNYTPDTTQPGTQDEIDAALEFSEWILGQLTNNREISGRTLVDLDVVEMNDQDWLDSKYSYSEFLATYG